MSLTPCQKPKKHEVIFSNCPKCSVWEVVLTLFFWFYKNDRKMTFFELLLPRIWQGTSWGFDCFKSRVERTLTSHFLTIFVGQSPKYYRIHYYFGLWSSPASTTILGFLVPQPFPPWGRNPMGEGRQNLSRGVKTWWWMSPSWKPPIESLQRY